MIFGDRKKKISCHQFWSPPQCLGSVWQVVLQTAVKTDRLLSTCCHMGGRSRPRQSSMLSSSSSSPTPLWCERQQQLSAPLPLLLFSPSLCARPLPSVLGSPPSSPLIFFCSSSCVLCSFVCLSPAPSIVPPVPPISALAMPSDPTLLCRPCPSCWRSNPPPPPHRHSLPRTPKSSCSSLDCSPFKFFFWGWGLITVASKLHTKSQRDCYCEAYKGTQAVMAISNRRAWPASSV